MDFPSSPSIGQEHEVNGKKWTWDGLTWNRTSGILTVDLIPALPISKTTGLQAALDGKVTAATTLAGYGITNAVVAGGDTSVAADLASTYQDGAVTTGNMTTGGPTINLTHLTARSSGDNRVAQLLFSGVGGAAVPDVWLRTSHSSGGWTSAYKFWTSANFDPLTKLDVSERGAVNGVASLDAGGKVPAAQLPSSSTMVAANSILGNNTGSSAGAMDLSAAQVKTLLALVKGDVGLGSVDNTTDANKPVSSAQLTALNLKANLAGPTFTGVPVAPTAAAGTSTTQLATTAFVTAADNLKANAANAALTGTTTAANITASGNIVGAVLKAINPITTLQTATLDIGQNPTGVAGDQGGYIYARGAGDLWFGTSNTLRGKMLANGTFDWNGTMGIGGSSVLFGATLSVAQPANTQVSISINKIGQASAQMGFLTGAGTVFRIGNTLADGLLANAKGIDIDGNGGLTGPGISDAASNGTIVKRHASGYIFANYFNCTADVTTTSPTAVMVETGSDGYLRKQTLPVLMQNMAVTGGPTAAVANDLGTCKQMRWKNFGAGHVIFDASQGTSPAGTAITSNANPDAAWQSTYPTIMGWNGSATYGVRVYIANLADGLSGVGIVAGSRIYAGYDAGIGNSISCSQWFRSNGDTGWYNSTWAGGWHMSDATYVRSYMNKAVCGGDFVITSDRKLKTGIRDFAYNGRLRPVNFYHLTSNKADFGFIADEVQLQYPEAVTQVEGDYRQLSYSKLTAILSCQVNAVEDKVVQLVQDNAAMRAQLDEVQRKLEEHLMFEQYQSH